MNFIQLFTLGYLISLIGISAYFYKHKDQKYAEGKTERIKSPKHFALIYRFIQFSTAVGVVFSQFKSIHLWGDLFDSSLASGVGLAMATAGISLFVWAKKSLGQNYSPCFDSYVPQGITSNGPYKWVRHPIYSANIALLIGIFLTTGHVLNGINALILTVYYFWSAQKEEQALSNTFPAYQTLIEHTGRFLPKFSRLIGFSNP